MKGNILFCLMVDTLSLGLMMHATILAFMFSLVEMNKITVPLSPSIGPMQNMPYVQEFLANLLKNAFPHLNELAIYFYFILFLKIFLSKMYFFLELLFYKCEIFKEFKCVLQHLNIQILFNNCLWSLIITLLLQHHDSPQIKVFIEGLFSFNQDVPQFKEHLRDFIVQIRVHHFIISYIIISDYFYKFTFNM